MFKLITRTLITAVAILLASLLISGVQVKDSLTAVTVAIVLGLLNTFVRPVLIVLTIPITIFTLGLFILVINMGMILWASSLINGFVVDGWWSAFLFSIVVSIISTLIQSLAGLNKKSEED